MPDKRYNLAAFEVVAFQPIVLNGAKYSKKNQCQRWMANNQVVAWAIVFVAVVCAVLLTMYVMQKDDAKTSETIVIQHALPQTNDRWRCPPESFGEANPLCVPSPSDALVIPNLTWESQHNSTIEESLQDLLGLRIVTIIASIHGTIETFDPRIYRSNVASRLHISTSKVQISVRAASVLVTLNIDVGGTSTLSSVITKNLLDAEDFTMTTTRPLTEVELINNNFVYDAVFIDESTQRTVEYILQQFNKEYPPSTPPPNTLPPSIPPPNTLPPNTPPPSTFLPSVPPPSTPPPNIPLPNDLAYESHDVFEARQAVQLESLRHFYTALNGHTWTNNANWNTDAHICQWVGLTCNSDGWVTKIMLPKNNLQGSLFTAELASLTSLQQLDLSHNHITGSFPHALPITLTHLNLAYNSMSGELPAQLESLTNLEYLHLFWNHFNGTLSTAMLNHSSLLECKLIFEIDNWISNLFECNLTDIPAVCYTSSMCGHSDYLTGGHHNDYEKLRDRSEPPPVTPPPQPPLQVPPLTPTQLHRRPPLQPPLQPPSRPPSQPLSQLPSPPPSKPSPCPPPQSPLPLSSSTSSMNESLVSNVAKIMGDETAADVNVALIVVLVVVAVITASSLFVYRRQRHKLNFAKHELLKSRTPTADRAHERGRIVVERAPEDDNESHANTVSTPREQRDASVDQMLTPRSRLAFNIQNQQAYGSSGTLCKGVALTTALLSKCAQLSTIGGRSISSPRSNNSSNNATVASLPTRATADAPSGCNGDSCVSRTDSLEIAHLPELSEYVRRTHDRNNSCDGDDLSNLEGVHAQQKCNDIRLASTLEPVYLGDLAADYTPYVYSKTEANKDHELDRGEGIGVPTSARRRESIQEVSSNGTSAPLSPPSPHLEQYKIHVIHELAEDETDSDKMSRHADVRSRSLLSTATKLRTSYRC